MIQVVHNTGDLILASPIIIKSGMKPHRIVLREITPAQQWVTHMETMTMRLAVPHGDPVDCIEVHWEHESYSQGHYFKVCTFDDIAATKYEAVVRDFHQRVAETCK